jgi:hypothetical protein
MEEKSNWSIPDEMAKFLEAQLLNLREKLPKNIRCLEFGTGAGKATKIMAGLSFSVHTFDADGEWTKHTTVKLKEYRNIRFYVGYEPNSLTEDKINFVFIDGPKKGSKESRSDVLVKFWDKIEPGATIIMDDCNRPEEKEALEKWKFLWGIDYKIIDKGRGIGIFKKPKFKSKKDFDVIEVMLYPNVTNIGRVPIPIYMMTHERPDHFKISMDSLLKTNTPISITIYDDESRNPEKINLLNTYNQLGNVEVITDIRKQTKQLMVNIWEDCFRHVPERDYCIHVQDDVIFHPEWLNKLLEVKDKIPNLGILTPWDRDAGWVPDKRSDDGWVMRNLVEGKTCQIGGPVWLSTRNFAVNILNQSKTYTGPGFDSDFQIECCHLGFNIAATYPSWVEHFGAGFSVAREKQLQNVDSYFARYRAPGLEDGRKIINIMASKKHIDGHARLMQALVCAKESGKYFLIVGFQNKTGIINYFAENINYSDELSTVLHLKHEYHKKQGVKFGNSLELKEMMECSSFDAIEKALTSKKWFISISYKVDLAKNDLQHYWQTSNIPNNTVYSILSKFEKTGSDMVAKLKEVWA